MNQFGDHIRQSRQAIREGDKAYSLRQVAARVGIEPAYLSKIERGVFQPPSEEVIAGRRFLQTTAWDRNNYDSSFLPDAV